MFKSLITFLFGGPTIPVEPPITDFAAPAKVRTKRKLPEIYADELERLTDLQATNITGMNENELNRLRQSIVTQMAKVNMYKARLDAQSPTV